MEQVLRYGVPIQLGASFKYNDATRNMKMSEPENLGVLTAGSFTDGNVTIKKTQRNY